MSTTALSPSSSPIGPLLRSWRQRRHLTQLDLANAAAVTTRHLSFLETGRARPSREMVLHLAEALDVPLRERNNLLIAAGFAPTFPERDLADASFDAVRTALDQVLAGHEPYPAIVVDRRWELVSMNRAAAVLTEGVDLDLLTPPVNVLRAAVHPKGLGPRVRNLETWADHICGRLQREAILSGDEDLLALEYELRDLLRQQGLGDRVPAPDAGRDIAVPLLLDSEKGPLRLVSTVATFGTALDITLAELVLEAFLPGDAETSETLHAYARERAEVQADCPVIGPPPARLAD